jgi:hypothetical protein
MFNARAWLAQQIGCEPDDLSLADGRPRSDWRGGHDATYTRSGAFAGRVLISSPRTMVETEPPHRIVTATWPAGDARTRITGEEPIDW